MRELIVEVLLRTPKLFLGLLVALVAWGFGVGVFDATPSVELWLLCWAGGAAFVLLVQEGPI